jgi:group I intron endonuclease
MNRDVLDLGGVYRIRHVGTGRLYIGSSVNMRRRWREHRAALCRGRHHSVALQRAWNKHGPSAFAFEPLLVCAAENAVFFEQRAIDALKPRLNCAPRAGSQLGYRHTPASVGKMKAAAVGRPSSFKGLRHSDESRRRISDSRRGKGGGERTIERRRKISEALRGRPVSAERRAKISATLTGRSTGRGALTVEQVREIRRLHSLGMRQCDIARAVNAKKGHVHNVIFNDGYTWVI